MPQTSRRSLWFGWYSPIIAVLGLFQLYSLLTRPPDQFNERFVATLQVGACFLLALIGLLLRFIQTGKPALAIDKTGIELPGIKLSWTDIVAMSWSPHESCTLNVQTASQRYWANVPRRYRSQVEQTLRRFGKWKD